MKKWYLKLLFISIIFLTISCKKNSESSIVGNYILEKTRYIEYENGSIILDEWDYESVSATLVIRADKTFSITYVDKMESNNPVTEHGTYHEEAKLMYIGGDATSYYFEENYLVMVTEDDENDKNLAYFKKK